MVTAHESGIHTRSLAIDKNSYQLFDAKEIGSKDRGIIYGKHSGKASVKNLLNAKGVVCTDTEIERVLSQIKIAASKNRSDVSQDMILQFAGAY